MNDDARDPYVGLNDYFGRKAAGAVPSWYAVGRVISTTPLKIRADGLDLDIEDLYIAQHLTAGWIEQLTGLGLAGSPPPCRKNSSTEDVTVRWAPAAAM